MTRKEYKFLYQPDTVDWPFQWIVEFGFVTSSKITSWLGALIKQESLQYDIIEDNLKNDKEKRLVDMWIYQLKLEFQTGSRYLQLLNLDSNYTSSNSGIWLRYGWEIIHLRNSCPCRSKFDIKHSMRCNKGGFTFIQLNDLRDQTANIMSEVCMSTDF